MVAPSPSPSEVVRPFLKDVERLGYDMPLKLVSGACKFTDPPPSGAVQGPTGIPGVLEPLFAPSLENEFKSLREAATGPIVNVERLDHHRLADKWVPLPATGVFDVRDGLITQWRDYFGAATILVHWPGA